MVHRTSVVLYNKMHLCLHSTYCTVQHAHTLLVLTVCSTPFHPALE